MVVTSTENPNYVPAAGRRAFTAIYDPMMAVTMRESVWRPAVVDAVLRSSPGDVLEVGCGTGSIAIPLAAAAPQAHVVGVDGDDEVLVRAQMKGEQSGVTIEWQQGLAQDIPRGDDSADVVVMCLVLHHLTSRDKRVALSEILRVLRPGGRLVVADWGKPRGSLTSAGFYAVQLLDGFETTGEHRSTELSTIISNGGFEHVRTEKSWRTFWGSLELCVADALG